MRIIAATNRNLEKAVEDKSFREDLFYRLNVFPIVVPPLRERVEDIPALAWEFVDEFSRSFGKPIESIARESVRELEQYSWPGNVRELRNVIERAVILNNGPHLTVPMPQPCVDREAQKPTTLASFEADHIRATLDATSWRIRGPRAPPAPGSQADHTGKPMAGWGWRGGADPVPPDLRSIGCAGAAHTS